MKSEDEILRKCLNFKQKSDQLRSCDVNTTSWRFTFWAHYVQRWMVMIRNARECGIFMTIDRSCTMKCGKSNNVCMLKLLIMELFWPRSKVQTMSGAKMPHEVKWQIVGLHRVGLFFKDTGKELGAIMYSTISCLVHNHARTNDVSNRRPSGWLIDWLYGVLECRFQQ